MTKLHMGQVGCLLCLYQTIATPSDGDNHMFFQRKSNLTNVKIAQALVKKDK